MQTFKYRNIHIVYADGTVENLFAVAGAIATLALSTGETAVRFFAHNGGSGYQPFIERYLEPKDRLEIRTHTVTVG